MCDFGTEARVDKAKSGVNQRVRSLTKLQNQSEVDSQVQIPGVRQSQYSPHRPLPSQRPPPKEKRKTNNQFPSRTGQKSMSMVNLWSKVRNRVRHVGKDTLNCIWALFPGQF